MLANPLILMPFLSSLARKIVRGANGWWPLSSDLPMEVRSPSLHSDLALNVDARMKWFGGVRVADR
jgi:hypothetical protein